MSSPNVSIPTTNYKQQLTATFKGLKKTAPGYLGLNQQYAPLYTDLNLNTLHQTLFGSPNAPGQLETMRGASTYAREGDVADIERLGRRGYDALMLSNPGLAKSLATANDQGGRVFAPGSLISRLQSTAGNELDLGGELSPQEITAITQGTRAGFADRGMTMGNQSLGAELLGRDAAMQQRLGQRIGWAGQVEGLAGQDRQYLDQLAQLNAGIYDPSQQVIARGSSSLSGLLGSGANANLMGTMNTQQLFNPQQGQDAFNTNTNAQASAAISNANSSAATNNALIGGGAAIAAAAVIAI